MRTAKYYTITAVTTPTEINPYGREYLGTVSVMEQACEGAIRYANQRNTPVEVTQCCMNPDHNRTVRYNPDGTVEKLWTK